MKLNLEKITGQVTELAREAALFISEESEKLDPQDVEEKGKNSLVTYVDKTAEKMLVKGLHKILPEAGFITEEATIAREDKPYRWIVDPLDGTTNFIHGLPCFCVSIGLSSGEEMVSGVIVEVTREEAFYAWKDSDAFLNGKKIEVTETHKLENSLLATGFPYYDYGLMNEYIKLFSALMQQCRGLRRLGSAAADLAYVACGRFEGFYEYGLSPWDVAAGALIVERAGGKVTDFSGGKNYIFGKEMLATNGPVHPDLLEAVSKCFPKK